MNRKHFLFSLFLILFLSLQANSQKLNPETTEYRYWIFFKDKGKFKPVEILLPGSEAYEVAKSELTEKAIWRRSKVLPDERVINYDDIPVNSEYIDEIKKIGLVPHAVSKWFNAVSVTAKKDKLDMVKRLGFVDKIEGVNFLEYVKIPSYKKIIDTFTVQPENEFKYNYGISYWQNRQINVPVLHNYGITGYGVTVGVCDDCFNWRMHQALKTRKVMDEYDWINKDDSVQYQVSPNQIPSDPFDHDDHGTATLSTIGGFYPGQLIGPAFDAEFYLSKTEYNPTETPVEEDYWVEAVEWMESQGIEVISCSLIYKPFDLPHNQYIYADMNGKTTIIVRAAEHASLLGVVVVNSMGNERQTDPPSIVSPPDGEHVIAVGAVDSSGNIAYFSSNGPTSDGRTKPDVVAMGMDVYTAVSYSSTYDTAGYMFANGTSFSAPLVAGVCALILSAHPELIPGQVTEALKMTANNKENPNNVYGWGLVNAYDAVLYHGIIMSNKPEIEEVGDNTKITIYVVSKNSVNPESVKMHYSLNGGEYRGLLMGLEEKENETNSGGYSVSVPFDLKSESISFYFSASDLEKSITVPFNAPQKFFYIDHETRELAIY
ncbi:MAG: S8 family serine peptidase [Chlorobi bacterium]|nr:S8 family serine peptidase [Chlorobiota bacterium]MCI0715323.1 S8 family serine peptidase [Chlorobiota bacterium]